MGNKRTFSVATIGIPEHDQHVLQNIFKLSLYRPCSYALANVASTKSEILIVDADDAQAMTEWQAFRNQHPNPATLSVIMVTQEKHPGNFPHHIRRPFVATRVLSVLDQVASQELDFKTAGAIHEETKPADQAAPTPQQPTTLAAPKIFRALVVDDSLPVRKQIELELKSYGIQVDTAETGERAFEMLDHSTYDIIFLDVILPGIDGYKICKTIKKDKAIKQTPVIMLTSKSSPFDRVKGNLAGCNTYLTKPVKQTAFQKVVKKFLE